MQLYSPDFSDPPRDVDIDVAKAAVEQVNKRLEAALTLKSSTETRALALATQCTTLLSAIGGATLLEWTGRARVQLIHAGFAGVVVLLAAVLCAHVAAKPTKRLYLPGRLPRELWLDLTADQMKGSEFMVRLVAGLNKPMNENEQAQSIRAMWFSRGIWLVVAAPIIAFLAFFIPPLGIINFTQELAANILLYRQGLF